MAPYAINNPLLQERINTLLKTLESNARAMGMSCSFKVMPGRVYARLVRVDGPRNQSCHGFVKLCDGGLYKSASWNQPAKGERYNLLNPQSFANVLRVADPHTGYLYNR